MMSRNILLLVFLTLSIVLLSYIGFEFLTQKKNIPTELLAVLKTNPIALNEFSLTDQNNRPFTLKELKSKNTLLFFGYTSCPDICPTTLNVLNHVHKQLEKEINVVFVSVDPQRDTTDKLLDYMEYFNKDFLGITGSKKDIDQFTKQFNAGYIIEDKTSDDTYLVSHTSSIFLINPELNVIAAFSPPHHASIISSQLEMINELYSE
jgi:protein SCO1